MLEHQLKHEHSVSVDMIEPKDPQAPALVAIGIKGSGEQASNAAQRVAQVLYHFLHDEAAAQKHLFLLTIEGERVDIEPLSAEEIQKIILEAKIETR